MTGFHLSNENEEIDIIYETYDKQRKRFEDEIDEFFLRLSGQSMYYKQQASHLRPYETILLIWQETSIWNAE